MTRRDNKSIETPDLSTTPGNEWRAGTPVRLPSGRVARLRTIWLETVVRTGKVPDLLTPIVVELMSAKRTDIPAPNNLEETKARIELLDELCRGAFVSPRIVDNPQADDEISIADLTAADRSFVWDWLLDPTLTLDRFLAFQALAMESMDATETDAPARE